MSTKLIDQVRGLDDLADGEIAAPEKGLDYTVTPATGVGQPEKVQFLIRRGEVIFAMTSQWRERRVNGDREGAYNLTATPNRKHLSRKFGRR